MSETMTASERALMLLDELIPAAYGEGAANSMLRVMLDPDGQARLRDKASRCALEKREAKAALLAYAARLEACVDAARLIVGPSRHPNEATAHDKLRASLAALDRPEDGE